VNRDELPLVVTANHPVVVERGLFRFGDPGGFAQSMAVASGAEASIPEVDTSAGAPAPVVTGGPSSETTLTPPPPPTESTTTTEPTTGTTG
jgi:hypothetical protein